jgi:hypothetical protein
MKEHCATKEGLSPEAFDTINWDAIEDSMDSSPELFNLWMTKQISAMQQEHETMGFLGG